MYRIEHCYFLVWAVGTKTHLAGAGGVFLPERMHVPTIIFPWEFEEGGSRGDMEAAYGAMRS